jgi:hypothetical protein
MTISVAVLDRNTLLTAFGALFNSGTIDIFTGAAPTNTTDADTGTKLGTLTFGATAFGTAAAGSITANAITQDSAADATGTAGYYRCRKTGGGAVIEQGTCGVGTGDLQLNTTSIVIGGPIQVTSFVRTL